MRPKGPKQKCAVYLVSLLFPGQVCVFIFILALEATNGRLFSWICLLIWPKKTRFYLRIFVAFLQARTHPNQILVTSF